MTTNSLYRISETTLLPRTFMQAFEGTALPPVPIRRHAAPRRFGARARLLAVASDVALLAICTALTVTFTRSRPSKNVWSAGIAATVLPASIWRSGLYAGSFATQPHDRVYELALPFAVTIASVLTAAAIPGLRIPPAPGLIAACTGFAGCAVARVLLHERLGSPSPPVAQRPIATPSRGDRGCRLKRTMDVCLTLLAAPLAAAISAVVALLIAADDGRPIIFAQERVGLNGKPFRLFKFRTMRRASDDAWAVADDRRVTRSGRFLRRTSLDELPQLLNVLRGEISLVGPRPEMLSYAREFARTLPGYADRHTVKPGITGWAQVTLPRILRPQDMEDVIAADLFYVEHASVVLDSMIIAKTAIEVLFHRAA